VRVGGALTLVAVHTTAPTDPHRWLADLGELRDAVRAQPPDLMAGDLNATADHAPMRDLLGEGLRDSAELDDRWRPTWPADHRGAGPTRLLPPVAPIDHVLVGPRLTAVGTATVHVAGTDHLAVVARVAPVR
jgi:endonuclease/exonuclease/phosphatase (EEP) superfamily protein YafD